MQKPKPGIGTHKREWTSCSKRYRSKRKMIKHTLSGVTLLSLMVFLSGCGRQAPEVIRVPVTKTVIEKIQTPDNLLRECDRPNMDDLETTGDLERVALEALSSLDTCNQDKKDIKEWQEAEVDDNV
jgi:hypothetical protein